MGMECCICLTTITWDLVCQECYDKLFNHKTEIVRVIASAIDFVTDPEEKEALMINIEALRKSVLMKGKH